MDEFQESVMIALLPITDDWCQIDMPHCTLAYCGELPDLKSYMQNEMAKDALLIAQTFNPIIVKVDGLEIFGQEDKVDVLRLALTQELVAMRDAVAHWDVSDFPEYKPHATVGPEGSFSGSLPYYLGFDRIVVSWGADNMVFPLNRKLVENSP